VKNNKKCAHHTTAGEDHKKRGTHQTTEKVKSIKKGAHHTTAGEDHKETFYNSTGAHKPRQSENKNIFI
jgi:hypothetical protein